MEGHKQKGASLPRTAGSALDDRMSPEASSGDLLKHAPCGVYDKYQSRNLIYTEEPVKGSLKGNKDTQQTLGT